MPKYYSYNLYNIQDNNKVNNLFLILLFNIFKL